MVGKPPRSAGSPAASSMLSNRSFSQAVLSTRRWSASRPRPGRGSGAFSNSSAVEGGISSHSGGRSSGASLLCPPCPGFSGVVRRSRGAGGASSPSSPGRPVRPSSRRRPPRPRRDRPTHGIPARLAGRRRRRPARAARRCCRGRAGRSPRRQRFVARASSRVLLLHQTARARLYWSCEATCRSNRTSGLRVSGRSISVNARERSPFGRQGPAWRARSRARRFRTSASPCGGTRALSARRAIRSGRRSSLGFLGVAEAAAGSRPRRGLVGVPSRAALEGAFPDRRRVRPATRGQAEVPALFRGRRRRCAGNRTAGLAAPRDGGCSRAASGFGRCSPQEDRQAPRPAGRTASRPAPVSRFGPSFRTMLLFRGRSASSGRGPPGGPSQPTSGSLSWPSSPPARAGSSSSHGAMWRATASTHGTATALPNCL